MSSDKILVLFDVDGTLTKSRNNIEPEMEEFLKDLMKRVSVGLVGGSDLAKIAEQMGGSAENSSESTQDFVNRYDYVFAENGLVAYRKGSLLAKQNIIEFMGETKLQTFINYCLRYMSELELPVKRGNFIEFRNGLINVCPVGRSCSQKERDDFAEYDAKHKIRQQFIDSLNKHFGPEFGLSYAIGGQISFDCFPKGWDKTYCLQFVDKEFDKIYFFGDKTFAGGNDYEIYTDPRTIGYAVTSPQHTQQIIKQLNF